MSALDRLRQLRDRSRILKAVHAVLRSLFYVALGVFFPYGMSLGLPNRPGIKLHPRFFGWRPYKFEQEVCRALDRHVTPGSTVLDVGAHVGLHTLRLSRAVGDAGQVIAIEPSPANAALLRKHLCWNACNNVIVLDAAVGETAGEIEFSFRPDPTDPGASANSMAYDIGGEKRRVKMVTIDEVCRGLTPSVIKIDVEGAELLAIRGAQELISRSSPVLLVAVHPEPMQGLGTSPLELVDFLQTFGYEGRRLDGSPATELGMEEIVFEKAGLGSLT
ncbi:MAG TPA: FkbM family methyltransferase [Hyphomicrobiaceae bacterium]|nr:FkbM family methyltransferase [Hyphomicrobiaceae bacterium]